MIINIAFSSDNNYVPFLCTAVFSLLKNSNDKNKYHIYILDGGITPENKNKILSSLNQFKNKKINFIKIDQKIFKNIKQFLQLNQSAYYRLLLPEILSEIKKIIYLDCDLLILKDISKLYKEKLDNKIIGINNRNLKTFEVDLEHSVKLANQIPDTSIKVSESGISDPKIITGLKEFGFQGFLIGENFMKEENPGEACQDFINQIR